MPTIRRVLGVSLGVMLHSLALTACTNGVETPSDTSPSGPEPSLEATLSPNPSTSPVASPSHQLSTTEDLADEPEFPADEELPKDEVRPEDRHVSIEAVSVDPAMGAVWVHATLAGVSTDSGSCTLTATSGSKSLTVTAAAVFNVDRTECGAFDVEYSELAGATWDLMVEFDAEGYEVAPAITEVEVP